MDQEEKEILMLKFAETNKKLMLANEKLEAANNKLMEYEEKAEKAEKASRMKSLFLANMSHEIRTPLNAIEGFSRVMAETESSEERMKYLEIIESNNARLLSLINEILDLSRVESGEIVIKKSPVNLAELCKSIKQLFKFRCPETVNLLFVEPTMPIMMTTDENRLTQVLSNLISNALKHTFKGVIQYGYEVVEDGQRIKFFVKDTGTGIEPEFIGHIFDTYASKDADQQKGYGLGLALCRIIIEKMGGSISVESVVNEGSTFTFVLPFHGTIGGLATSNRTNTTTNNVRTIHIERQDESNMKTILVAEDEESNYELVRIVLQRRYRLLRAHNGIEAVTMNEDEHPDLILMDIRMPEMDGLDATRIIKEVNQNTPVIALSAYAFEENIKEAKAAGCDYFMAKPFRVEDLIEICAKYCNER
jgi:CheY-like chemotaxis protein/nitrogen-specific signal transduction histidine kinase